MPELIISNPTIKDVVYELINELGFCISEDNYLKFQSGEIIKFNGKNIRYSFDCTFLLEEDEIWFDPINNLEMIKNLYNYYVVDLYNSSKIKIVSTKENREKMSNKRQLIISLIDENSKEKIKMSTIFYNNIALAYIQFMLRDVMVVESLDN